MDEIEIRRVFGKETFRRGRNYFEEGRVDNAVKLGDFLFAEVHGTSKYLTRIRVDILESRCSCPVGYNCKHGAALALHLFTKTSAKTPSSLWHGIIYSSFDLMYIVEVQLTLS